MKLILDTSLLGRLCHPTQLKNRPFVAWLNSLLRSDTTETDVFVPEVCDYELRRKLLHMISKGQTTPRSIDILDELASTFFYLPLDTHTMFRAAELWSELRSRGVPTASDAELDGDVILAAQAESVGAIIVTETKNI
jgi:predicted nucleic acid-binding protein